MQSLVLNELGQLPQVESRVLPELASGHARIRMYAAALNRRDVWIMRGQYPGIRYPIVLGSDGCGVVETVADGDPQWVGQRVGENLHGNQT